jgi:hypothetical protein
MAYELGLHRERRSGGKRLVRFVPDGRRSSLAGGCWLVVRPCLPLPFTTCANRHRCCCCYCHRGWGSTSNSPPSARTSVLSSPADPPPTARQDGPEFRYRPCGGCCSGRGPLWKRDLSVERSASGRASRTAATCCGAGRGASDRRLWGAPRRAGAGGAQSRGNLSVTATRRRTATTTKTKGSCPMTAITTLVGFVRSLRCRRPSHRRRLPFYWAKPPGARSGCWTMTGGASEAGSAKDGGSSSWAPRAGSAECVRASTPLRGAATTGTSCWGGSGPGYPKHPPS